MLTTEKKTTTYFSPLLRGMKKTIETRMLFITHMEDERNVLFAVPGLAPTTMITIMNNTEETSSLQM